jgi:hypothetical protein
MSEQTTDDGRQQQQESPLQTELGITTIQDGVVSTVAGLAAQEVEGVRMGSGTWTCPDTVDTSPLRSRLYQSNLLELHRA